MAITSLLERENLNKIRHYVANSMTRAEIIAREASSIQRGLVELEEGKLSKYDKELLETNRRLASLIKRFAYVGNELDELFIDIRKEEDDPKQTIFTVYFRDGERLVISGKNIYSGLKRRKINPNRMNAISWFDVGVTNCRWDPKKREWSTKPEKK